MGEKVMGFAKGDRIAADVAGGSTGTICSCSISDMLQRPAATVISAVVARNSSASTLLLPVLPVMVVLPNTSNSMWSYFITNRLNVPGADGYSHFSKCYKIKNLTDEEATLLEPASCAIHGMDKLKMPFGAKVLLIGAGPTGLILAQLMKVNKDGAGRRDDG